MKVTWRGIGAPLVAGLLVHATAVTPAAQADVVNVATPGVYIQEIDDFGSPVTGAPALQVVIGDVSVSGGGALIASSVSDFTAATSSASPAVTQAVADYFTYGGDRLAVVGAASAEAEDLMAALDSLSVNGALDLFLPELRGLGDGDWQDVAARLVAAAGERNAMAWLDPPADAVGHGATPTFADPGGVAALGRQLRSTVGVGAEQTVLLNGGVVDAAGIARAASPGVLGLRAASDADDGIWMAMDPLPGLEGVMPEDPLPVAGIGILRSAGVTSIFRFDDAYTSPEIAVTLATANDVHYAATRRMLLWVRQSVERGMLPFVFAANDMNTWTSVTENISSFLTEIWQEGGLEGGTPAEAFAAQCSAQPTMILAGYLQCDVRLDLVTGAWQSFSLTQMQAS
jgi:hypothetical protein